MTVLFFSILDMFANIKHEDTKCTFFLHNHSRVIRILILYVKKCELSSYKSPKHYKNIGILSPTLIYIYICMYTHIYSAIIVL